MDRFNWSYYNTDYNADHYYSQAPQEGGQHTSQPEAGQTSAASGLAGSHLAPGQSQPYPSFNTSAHIPSWPGPDGWEYIQPQLEAGQTSTGVPAIGPSGQPQPYPNFNTSAQIPSWPGPGWWEYIQPEAGQASTGVPARGASGQPQLYLDFNTSAQIPSSSNPRPHRRASAKGLPKVKDRFLAGLEAFGRDASLKDCSSSLQFSKYISDNGSMVGKGISLLAQLTSAEKAQLDRAIIARQGAKLLRLADEETVEERFLAGLDHYEQGAQLVDCSATLSFKAYVTDDGHLTRVGEALYAGLSREVQERIDQALLSRKRHYRERPTFAQHFLEGLDNYERGALLKDCSASLSFKDYVSDDGHLKKAGETLRAGLPPELQERVDQALLSRRHWVRMRGDKPVEERFLAGLDKYAQGAQLKDCSATLSFKDYVTDDGHLHPRRQSLYDGLSQDDKTRVDEALTARGKKYTQRIAKDVANFMAALVPYANGLSLRDCGTLSGLTKKVFAYLTPEGGLTYKGQRLIENLQPSELNKVLDAIKERQQHVKVYPKVPGFAWQQPEMPLSMPEMGGMDPAVLVDPIRTEAMWVPAWQLLGQTVPGTRGIPSESAQSSIPYYGSDAVGADFQHRYDSNGLMPQRAPDRLIGRGIVHDTLINIQGEEYRVHDTGRRSVNPTNENPQGNIIMLVPRMRGG
ncbi:MAG: hypothetical protein P8X89_14030 [Reinekea sp.]